VLLAIPKSLRCKYLLSFKEELAEITIAVEILDNALVAGIVEKIVNNFDNEWVRLLFHQPYLFQHCLLLFILKKVKCDI
jgi:hypothetical protein